ncbi:MAG: tetratricopeptide repeat protein [Bacteroidales bacterium]|nr:tetratricopeptide repeat protein [Bacteroidales bacterium]
MAKVTKNENEAIRQENIAEKVSQADLFYNENKKLIWGIAVAVVLIGAGILAYSKFIYQPKCAEAMQQAYPAEQAFESASYEEALDGDGNFSGLADIIREYGAKAGKAIYLEAGISALQLGRFEDAVGYLKKYDGKEPLLAARALACLGDAYVGLEDYQAALSSYLKAAAVHDDDFAAAYLLKAAGVYEKLGEKAKALDCYLKIKDRYPNSIEGYDIDKYIARAEAQ